MNEDRSIQKREPVENLPAGMQPLGVPAEYEPPGDISYEEPAFHLWDYIALIWRRRWLVILVFLLSVSLTVAYVRLSTPTYLAVAKIRIDTDVPDYLRLGTSIVSMGDRVSFNETQRQIIQGEEIAREVVEKLNLFSETKQSAWGKSMARLRSLLHARADLKELDPEVKMQGRVEALLNSLSARPVGATQIFEVAFRGPDPKLAADIVNAVCEAYIQRNSEMSKHEMNWLREKLLELKSKLAAAETKAQDFAKDKSELIQSVENPRRATELDGFAQRLAEGESLLFERQFELRSLESDTSFVALLRTTPEVGRILADMAELEVRVDQESQRLGPEALEMRVVQAARKRRAAQLGDLYQRALAEKRLECNQLEVKQKLLKEEYEKARNQAFSGQQFVVQYDILRREVEFQKTLYESVLRRMQEVDILEGLKAGKVSIFAKAKPPLMATSRGKQKTLLLGCVLGIFFGIGLVLFLDYMDTTVKSPEQAEKLALLPSLGFIPHHRKGRRSQDSVALATYREPKSGFAESFRYLRTSVLYAMAGSSPKTILVTSPLEEEGKSTVATNMAIAFAQKGKKVLLLDGDLSRPVSHRFFDTDGKKGLTEILTGKQHEADGSDMSDLLQTTRVNNLFFLPSGSRVPNPVDLLDSDVMRDLLVMLSEQYDQIVIDSAPLLLKADTSVLIPYVDGVILVVKPGKTPWKALLKAKERVVGMQGRILGVVFNDPKHAPREAGGYGYGYLSGAYSDKGRGEGSEASEHLAEAARSEKALRPLMNRKDT